MNRTTYSASYLIFAEWAGQASLEPGILMRFTSCSPGARAQWRASVGILVEGRYLTQNQPAGLAAALRSTGSSVRTLVVEETGVDLCGGTWWDRFDVIVGRGRSDALLAALRAAQEHGLPVVDPPASIQSVLDKAGMAAALAAAGIPTPRAWLGHPQQLAGVPRLGFPLVLKPMTGDNARGLVVVSSRDELVSLDWAEPVALAQEFHRGDGHDLKLYVAGDSVWAVRRPSPVDDDGALRDTIDDGRRVAATSQLKAIALSCARLFGLSLCGVDCVVGPAGPLVIEVNDFPNYRGLGRSVDHGLARVVLARARPVEPAGSARRSGVTLR
jgi:ribosomal protein S6--L-glutamate ligase